MWTSFSQRQSQSPSKPKPKVGDKGGDNGGDNDCDKSKSRSKSKSKSERKSKSKSKHKDTTKSCTHCETEHSGQPCPAYPVIASPHHDDNYSLEFWAQDPTTTGPSFQHNTAEDSIAAHIQMNYDHCHAVDMQFGNSEESSNDNRRYDWQTFFFNDR